MSISDAQGCDRPSVSNLTQPEPAHNASLPADGRRSDLQALSSTPYADSGREQIAAPEASQQPAWGNDKPLYDVTVEYRLAERAAEGFNPGEQVDIAKLMRSAFVHGYAQALISLRGDIKMIAAPEAAGEGWRPIETAPKDGTEIAIWTTHGPVMPVEWAEGWSRTGAFVWGCEYPYIATHWMPLPEPPK